METINDIMFSRIGSKKRLRDPDWSKVPIWWHVVDPAVIGTGTTIDFDGPPKPGIHYAYPDSSPVSTVILVSIEKEIREIIDECLNHMDPPCPPAGMVRGILKTIVPPAAKFNREQREKFCNLGINPLVYTQQLLGTGGFYGGKVVLWGQKFCTLAGVFEEIVDFVDLDIIHPEFKAFLE